VFVWPPAPSGCCGDCAATGGAKSSATINASFFIFATRFCAGPSSTSDACCHYRTRAFIVGPDRGFWTAEASWGRGLTLATNTKAHRGSIVPPAGPENESTGTAESVGGLPTAEGKVVNPRAGSRWLFALAALSELPLEPGTWSSLRYVVA
jgi:hypothetical protein